MSELRVTIAGNKLQQIELSGDNVNGAVLNIPAPTSFAYIETLSIPAGATNNYLRIVVKEDRGTWAFGSLTNVSSFNVAKNYGAYSANPASISVVPGDIIEIYCTKTTPADAASIAVSASYSLTTPLNTSTTGTLTYVDAWMLDMLAKYQVIHDNQLDEQRMIDMFLSMISPGFQYNGTTVGNFYNQFGPPGYNKNTADWFFVLFRNRYLVASQSSGYVTTGGTPNTKIFMSSGYSYLMNGTYWNSKYDSLPYDESEFCCEIITPSTNTNLSLAYYNIINAGELYGKLPVFDVIMDMSKVLTWSMSGNNIRGRDIKTKIVLGNGSCGFNSTKISGKVPLFLTTNNTAISINIAGNRLESWDDTNFGFISTAITALFIQDNRFPTSVIDMILIKFNIYFQAHIPTQNIQINASGARMGIPTGGNNNADRLALIATFAAAGKVAAITVRTS